MRRAVSLFIAAISSLTALTIAGAAPGPNGNNNHGLCTAYFNGSQTGRDNKHQAGPFVALEAAANARDGKDNDDDGLVDEPDEVARAVWDWCGANTGGKGVGGQPANPYEESSGNGKKGKGKG